MCVFIKNPSRELRDAIKINYPTYEAWDIAGGVVVTAYHAVDDPFSHKYHIYHRTTYTKTQLTFDYSECTGIEIKKGGF